MMPGFVGKPKGAAHIAFERILLDASLKLPNGKKVSFACAKTTRGRGSQIECSFHNNRPLQNEEAKGEARQINKTLRNLEPPQGFCKQNTTA
jgi:hypothetical protein